MVRDDELKSLADFRYELRIFLRVSEDLCKAEGVTALQYQMLLQTRAFAGRDWALVGELAHRLQTSPHGAVALVSRAQAAGLVTRVIDDSNRRQVQVHATAMGRRVMHRIAGKHLHELESLYKVFSKVGAAAHR